MMKIARTAALFVFLVALLSPSLESAPVAEAAPTPRVVLTVRVVNEGDGKGWVGTSVGECRRSTCAFSVVKGSTVSLTHHAGAESDFAGWQGACARANAGCSVKMLGPRSVGARFKVSAAVLKARRDAISRHIQGLGALPTAAEEKRPTGPGRDYEQVLPDDTTETHTRRFSCTTTPYTMTANPEKIVTINPDASKLWLGGLLQGTGYAGGLGSLKSLPINKRAPLTIFADVLGANVTRTVAKPNAATVQAAIGDLIKKIEDAETAIPTVALFRQTTASSVQEGILNLGFSARYLAGKASGSLNVEHAVNESTVMASLEQRYYTLSIVVPPTPADYFDLGELTVDDIQEQQRLGRLGPQNPPVVVSSIPYGRTFLMTVTAKTTHDKLSAALSAEFSTAHAGGSVSLTAEQKRILSTARIEVVSNGGDEQAFREAVRSQKIDAILARPSKITAARPISYQVDNIGDNSAAKFSETANYNLTECRPHDNKLVSVGEVAKLSNLRVYSHKCDYSVYGTLYVNGAEIFTRSRDAAHYKIPAASWWTVQVTGKWPTFSPPDPEKFHIAGRVWEPDGLYIARFSDPKYGPTNTQFRVSGNLNAWNWIWGDPANVFDTTENSTPFAYGERGVDGGSAHCPMTLYYTLEKAADLVVAVP